MGVVDRREHLAQLIREHPFASGDGTAEELAQDIADAIGPQALMMYEPDLEEVVSMKERVQYKTNSDTGEIELLDEYETDINIQEQIRIWSEYVVKLVYLQRIRAQKEVNPSWWRKALGLR